MKFNATPADRSTVLLEVELPGDRVKRSIDVSVRHIGQRHRVPGFRPGRIPRPMLERALGIHRDDPDAPDPIYDDAKEHLFESSVIEALRESELDVLAIPAPQWTSFHEQDGAAYRVTLPVRPAVKLGAYTGYPFTIEVEEIDEAKVEAVVEELRDQQASLVPVEGRGAQDGDYAVVGFEGRRDGALIEGAQSERFPLIIGKERMIPGFEAQLVGLREDDEKVFSVTFPEDYGQAELAGQEVEFTIVMRELREKQPPALDDDFARSLGGYADLATLRTEIERRLERSARDRARHAFADHVIEFATANATLDVPELLVEREMDVMIDELKVRLAEQRIGFEEYQKATERDEAAIRAEYREQAEKRVTVLLVLGAIADAEGVEVPDGAVEAEIERGRQSAESNPRLVEYLESERGRSYLRSQLRRTQVVESLIDKYIAEHPEFSDVRHTEDIEAEEAVLAASAAALAAAAATQTEADEADEADEPAAVPAEDPVIQAHEPVTEGTRS
ncbi:MAG: trigger factor [Chloroflexota bacterium]|nr:trigger factor [Chloroflexota bacterium]